MSVSASDDPDGSRFAAWQERTFPDLCAVPADGRVHRELADHELGRRYKRPPEALARLFGWQPGTGLVQRAWRRTQLSIWRTVPRPVRHRWVGLPHSPA